LRSISEGHVTENNISDSGIWLKMTEICLGLSTWFK